MIIEKVSVLNWMGHDSKEITFKEGRNLVLGRNASGKSSLAKAIAYGLSGEIPKIGIRKKGKKDEKDDRKEIDPRRDQQKEAIVTLNVIFGDNNKYIIRRQYGTGKNPIKAIFIYSDSNQSEALYTSEKAEKFIEQNLAITKEMFDRIIYMKEDDVYEFLLQPDKKILDEINVLSGLDKPFTIAKSLEEKIKVIEREIRKVGERKDDFKSGMKVKFGLDPIEVNEKEVKKELPELRKRIDILEGVKEILEKREQLFQEIKPIKDEINEKNEDYLERKLIELLSDLNSEKSSHELERKKVEMRWENLQNEINKKKAQIELKEILVKSLETSKKDRNLNECPTCLREMNEELTAKVLTKLKGDIDQLNKETLKEDKEIIKEKQMLQDFDKKIEQVDKNLSRIRDMKENTINLLARIQQNRKEEEKFQGEQYPRAINDITSELEIYNERMIELNQITWMLKGAKMASEEKVMSLKEEGDIWSHKKRIYELIIESLNKTIDEQKNEFIAKLKNLAEEIWRNFKGDNWKITWNEETFIPIAKPMNSKRELNAYEMSGSEKFLIFLAIRLAFQKSLEHFNLLIIDEPCQHLDENSGLIFSDILTSIGEDKIKQSIIFTYNEDFRKGDWSNIIEL